MSKNATHNPEVLTALNEQDFTRLAEILPAAFGSIAVSDLAEFTPIAIEAPNSDVLVSRDDRGAIASVMVVNITFGLGKLRGWIDDVATHEDSRRRGHGGALLDFALDWFRYRQVKRIALTSNDDRLPAHHLYLSRGFKIHDTNKFQLDLDERA